MTDKPILRDTKEYRDKLAAVKVGDLVVYHSPFPNMRYLVRVKAVTPKFIVIKMGVNMRMPERFKRDTGTIATKGWDIYLDFPTGEDELREIISQLKTYLNKVDVRKLDALPSYRLDEYKQAYKLIKRKEFELPTTGSEG